jgi:hypothetical protein
MPTDSGVDRDTGVLAGRPADDPVTIGLSGAWRGRSCTCKRAQDEISLKCVLPFVAGDELCEVETAINQDNLAGEIGRCDRHFG